MHISKARGYIPVLATQWSYHKAQHSLDPLGLLNNTFTVVAGWGRRASKGRSSKEQVILNPEANHCNMNTPRRSFTAPPGKSFEAWQWKMRREPTAPSMLAGDGSARTKMPKISVKAGLGEVKEAK